MTEHETEDDTEHDIEREITADVALCLPDGRLNPDAVGWSRAPLHDTSGIGRGVRGLGRNKRWEYWAVVTPDHVVALTTSALDYAALHQVWVWDRASGEEVDAVAIAPLTGSATLPGRLGGGPVRSRTRSVAVAVDERPGGTRLRARTARVELDVTVARPAGRDLLAVVVPWSRRRFQYTVKDVGLPVAGTLRVDGVDVPVPVGSWAVLDHGRGRWPYRAAWQWGVGVGSGVTGSGTRHEVAVQLGGTWTRQGPTTENGVFVDGRLHKVHDELDWTFDRGAYTRWWRVRGERLDLTFVPAHDRVSRTQLGVLASSTHQCFGAWSGWVMTDDGARLDVECLDGWAEDVAQRW
ncbi:DUF2804 domain-containing protein [Isoptericola sp. NPDC019482]|uniref:DUF2804 domain-containing protein n=1 Tax=Isoptericola sp. NPDC019482 TaxID=3154688 RepID=UPI003478B57C